ncbi:hypothetical protein EX895_002429 [Sporisorium graminicola]|uniref:Dynamin-binding protein n=1 Tax=Sporisorium graminicola TaxID=280036 RepID=A0A4U7KZB8_9BASI|nr:hypothetical protein EX895_002429 [Sporisorium graminicola]TKY88798.1 hypothetical protein EX895_002429 [Sporisorium graminicola]
MLRVQRSLSPSSISAASPIHRRPSYGPQLSVPGSAPGVADPFFDQSSLASSPGASSRHRRGSRSSILASASEVAGTASDRESIRSAGSSSRIGPSTPTQKARRTSRGEDFDRNASPVSFYSSFEAPLTSPRQSRQGSLQPEPIRLSHIPRSPSPTHLAAAHSSPNGPYRSPPSKHKSASRDQHQRDDATPTKRSVSAQHVASSEGPAWSSSNSMRSFSANSWQQPNSPTRDPPSSRGSDAIARPTRIIPTSSVGDSFDPKPRAISTSRSTNGLKRPDDLTATRPRSKSSISSKPTESQPSVNAQSSSSGVAPSSIQSTKTLAPVPSKLSLRSRIFGGLKPTNSASPTASSFGSGTETPSPRSPHFSPSIHSEGSHSDRHSRDYTDGHLLDPAQALSHYAESSQSHGRGDDDGIGETANGDLNANAITARKASSASSFLRKTMRFKEKPAFLKSRPSVSSMNSDSAASTSTSVPPSPLDPPINSEVEDAARNAPFYKQVSGRRGLQYRQAPSESANGMSSETRLLSQATEGEQVPSAIRLLPAVTERDLEGSPKLQRSLSYKAGANPDRQDPSSPTVNSHSNESGAMSQQMAVSPLEAGSRSRIPRSSSLHGYVGRNSPSAASPLKILSEQAAASPSSLTDVPASPRRRPRSGSDHPFSPQIQPRTTSSPRQSSARRPLTSQGSPSPAASPKAGASYTSRSTQRASRPKTADSGHTYSGSLSSLRDIMMVANAISEEGAVYHTPEKTQIARFESNASPSTASQTAASPSEQRRPGLPPKNPLRKQRPSGASVTSTPSVSGNSPASVHTSGVFPGPSMARTADDCLLRPASKDAAESKRPIPASVSTPSLTDLQAQTSNVAQFSPMDRQTSGDYVLSRDAAASQDASQDTALAHVPSRSSGLAHGTRSSSSSPAQASFGSTQQLSRAPSTDSTVGWVARRHERSVSDAASSFTDLKNPLGMGASTPSLSSETSSGTKKKKEGPGSKIFSFARDITHRDGSNDATSTITSSGTFRLGRNSKSKKADASSRPVIRRLYDGPLESEASASAASHASANGLHSPLQYTSGVSPGTSVVDLQTASGSGPPTPGSSATPGPSGHRTGAGNLVRSASSSGSTARDLLSPASGHLMTPQLGNNGGYFLPRSPSYTTPAWSIPQDDLSQEQKRFVRRWFVLRELLETEKAYASDLAVARDIYLARAKMRAGITAPLSPLSVRSASIFSQLASPEPSTHSRSSQSHLQQRGGTPAVSPGPSVLPGRSPLPQRALFRNASADATVNKALASPSSVNQTASSVSLTSSNPSNRSSMFTVSSQSSQTSDASHFALSGHPTAGLPSQFSIEGNALSPVIGHIPSSGTPNTMPNPGASPLSSALATPSISTPSGILSPGSAGSADTLPAGSPDAPFSASDVRIVFAQLETCAAFADEMVVILEGAVGRICSGTSDEACQLLAQGKVIEESETDRVGQAFLKLMPRIEQVYSAYCSRHEASMARLQELLTTQPKVSAFLSECTQAARAYTNAWDLSSLLIKPVQRVLKYPLLLSQILASTSSKHPDMESLSAASVEIQKVADNINEVKKRKDLVEQIVSGRVTKRSTSQRMQHGATKKLLRRQEKVRKLVVGRAEDVLVDDGQYKALVAQFQQLEKSTSSFARRCTAWSSSIKDAHLAQLRLLDQWCNAYAVDEITAGTEAENRLRTFVQLIEDTLLGEFWAQLDVEMSSSLKPAVHRITALFALPQSVIAKRDDREPDYTRYQTEISRGGSKAVDKKLAESAAAFVALHTQLMDELPQFNYGVQTLLDLCIESLSRTQASYHLRVHRALIGFWQSHGPEGNTDIANNAETNERSMRHLNPVKMFWPLHSSISEFAESLGIVRGIVSAGGSVGVDERASRSASLSVDSDSLAAGNLSPSSTTHFSPLQWSRALPDAEFASSVPDATSMSQKIESITAAGSEEMLDTIGARASPSPFATPPLGSHRGASASPQLRQPALLGSPAPIGAAPLVGDSQQQQQQQSALRTAKSGGGLIGLLRSVGSSSAVGSRKNSQSADTAHELFVDGLSSDPPTPISKDTPAVGDSAAVGEPVAPPKLPALTFNSGFFGQSDTVFNSASAQGLDVEANEVPSDPSAPVSARQDESGTAGQAAKVMGTVAAVANSPSAASRGSASKNGYPLVEYAVGDLFRVADHDEVHLFGHSEHGVAGWVERENFEPLP